MAHRYAILWEIAPGGSARPVGLAVEQDDFVLVEARDDLCIPTRYDQPFTVAGPDQAAPVIYHPGDPQYFEQVLVDLSRAFAITGQAIVPGGQASEGTILRLLTEHVTGPLRRELVSQYPAMVARYPAIQRYRQKYYLDDPGAATRPAPTPGPAPVATPEGSFVVA